ncbi:UDP-glucose 4-epimerase [Marinilactibacillus psychrotolerans 42ea]|uniref:UDP-glucose 4-epimerase n=1 Tax=Marinilactibacillus psychrotolerans 42ea TaxID=1255609 RepID=A0A1R4K1F0_9LACT|nr:NAD-dependent epimerase/dehydratase family protein [Marinilactibacillus psychrotolerans]SJN37895.1 UDP-glucose 4-epimerase [Marinilactibacillus psychrotolerans 42ea]
MKKILITGSSSYVGTSFKEWLEWFPGKYIVDSISLRNELWREKDFSGYDAILHVAGIAHIKETKKNIDLYYEVNRDLAFETAKKAKSYGVKQFIFLSSMSVYGVESGVITKNSSLNPKSNYGKSKLQAEELIKSLENDNFQIAILRPPMIYGRNCKGNYPKLARFSLKVPFFPNVINKRSMLYIDHLSEFVRILIDECSSGQFFPQNKEYVCTTEVVKAIAEAHNKKVRLTKIFNPILKLLKVGAVNKVFGNLVYEKEMSGHKTPYCIYDFSSSISLTERKS